MYFRAPSLPLGYALQVLEGTYTAEALTAPGVVLLPDGRAGLSCYLLKGDGGGPGL